MMGLSDHLLVIAKLYTSLPPGNPSKSSTSNLTVLYRWVEGTGVNKYAISSKSWLEFTQRPDFVDGL
jgi:hypothetical protein